MKKNIGTFDRLLRLAIALFLFAFAYYENSYLAFFGGIFVFWEALFSWCIFYQIIGKSSCPINKK